MGVFYKYLRLRDYLQALFSGPCPSSSFMESRSERPPYPCVALSLLFANRKPGGGRLTRHRPSAFAVKPAMPRSVFGMSLIITRIEASGALRTRASAPDIAVEQF
jgi:hypothetical protein